jgi:hypothetical protein
MPSLSVAFFQSASVGASWQPRAPNGLAILLRGASIDEQIGQQILRTWHHCIACEIDDALGGEHLLVDVEIAGVLAAVAVQDDVCGIVISGVRQRLGSTPGIIANAAV